MTHFQPNTSRKLIDYQQLRRDVSLQQVLQLIDWKAVSQNGPQQRGPCPVHQSTNSHSRSFSVHLEKNVYQCFGCNSHGNQLDLAAAVLGLELYAVARELCHRLQIELPQQP